MAPPEPIPSPEQAAAKAARTIALQMLEERGRGAVLVGVARVDAALEHLLQAVMAPAASKDDGLFLPERPLGSIGAKVALASRLGLIDAGSSGRSMPCASCATPLPIPQSRHPSPIRPSLPAGRHLCEARANPLWAPLDTALAAQPTTANDPLDPALRDYILLITILVAFLEATAQQLQPYQPPVVMGLGGVTAATADETAPDSGSVR